MLLINRFIAIVLLILCLAVLGLGVVVAFSQSRLSETARNNHRLALQAKAQTQTIQTQRYQAALRNCLDSNGRHDATVAALRREINTYERTPRYARRKAEIEASFNQTVLLINALAPKHPDCVARAKRATS